MENRESNESVSLEIRKGAVLSDCGKYRYRLTRSWDDALPRVVFVMLNPSTADASLDDPTIRRCIRFAKDQGFGSLEVVNISPYRSTKPGCMRHHKGGKDENCRHLREVVESGAMVVCAWGSWGGVLGEHQSGKAWLLQIAHRSGVTLHCLGTTKDGHPRHPLYVPASQRFVPLKAGVGL